jgi:hypothetical protein
VTWFVEGAAESVGVRIVMSRLVGGLLLVTFARSAQAMAASRPS